MKKIVTSWILCVLVLCVLVLAGLFAWLGHGLHRMPSSDVIASSDLIHSEFTLQDATGKTVTATSLRGKYLLVYFGYTHCPDVCPTTLLLMQNALHHLNDIAPKVQPIFITVDPERDTPSVIGAYARNFGDRLMGLTGTPEQVHAAADNFKVYYSKVLDKHSSLDYVVDHSGFIYLMGPDGHYVTHFAHNVSETELEEGLRTYVH
jgi:protein SCO1/2